MNNKVYKPAEAKIHPQVTELTEEEKIRAALNPHSIRNSDNELSFVPPVEVSWVDADYLNNVSWLNGEFVADDETVNLGENLLYYTGAAIDSSTVNALCKLIESNNELKILTDDPDTQPEKTETVQKALFEIAGLATSEVASIGSQYYFAYQFKFNDSSLIREEPLGYSEAYELGSTSNDPIFPYVSGKGLRYETSFSDVMDADQAEEWWNTYNNSFSKLEGKYPCRQGMERDDFIKAMANPGIAKYTTLLKKEPVAMTFMGPDWDNFPWINPGFYEHAYPEKFADDSIMYFPGIFSRKFGAGLETVKALTQVYEIAGNEIIYTFDCCETNKDVVPILAKSAIESTGIGVVHELPSIDPITYRVTSFK